MNEDYMDFESARLMGLVRRHAMLIGLAVIVGMGMGLVQSVMGGVRYTASAEVLVGQPVTTASLVSAAPTGVDQDRLVNFAMQTIDSRATAEVVERKLGILEDDYELDVAGAASFNVVRIDATADNAVKAADIANAFAAAYIDGVRKDNLDRVDRASAQVEANISELLGQIRQIRTAGGNPAAQVALLAVVQGRAYQIDLNRVVDPAGGAQVVDPAVEGTQSLLGTALPVVLGGLLGLIVGLAVAAFLDRRNRGPAGRRSDLPAQRDEHHDALSV